MDFQLKIKACLPLQYTQFNVSVHQWFYMYWMFAVWKKSFGDFHSTICYCNQSMSIIFSCDAFGFRKFNSFVLRCETFSKSIAWNALETLETLCILVSKLPGSLRDRWNRRIQVVRRSFGREPCLSDFASFVHEETTLVNDPIFSKDAVLEYVQTPEKKQDKKKKYGSFATKGGEVVKCSV